MRLFSRKKKKNTKNERKESFINYFDSLDVGMDSKGVITVQNPTKSDTFITTNNEGQKEYHTVRIVMTKGSNSSYFFKGDKQHPSGTLQLLTPLDIDVNRAEKYGVNVSSSIDGAVCKRIAENKDYIFYNYGCFKDGSGGCNLRQSKQDEKQVVFFGEARILSCIFHGFLFQVNHHDYGSELYLWAKDVETGNEKVFSWFGKYSIPTGFGSRYSQDDISEMYVDEATDTLIIKAHRRFCETTLQKQNIEDDLFNIETDYYLSITFDNFDFHATAIYDKTSIKQFFDNKYQQE